MVSRSEPSPRPSPIVPCLCLARMCMLVDAILLTHGGASPVEREPYLQGRLSPLVPVCLYGRDATQEPVCAREQSVYYA